VKERFDRIVVDPAVLNGQPTIRGTRLTVRRVWAILATFPTRDELFENYPRLSEEDLQQALEYAATFLPDRTADFPAA